MNKKTENTRLPTKSCVLCERTLEEVGGGKRIIAQQLRGLKLSKTLESRGYSGCHERFFPLHDDDEQYLLVWGEKLLWNENAIERAKKAFQQGYRPWLCQLCAVRACSKCGAPINYPMGSDIIYSDGYTSHVAIQPFDPGCNNKACKKYRAWNFNKA